MRRWGIWLGMGLVMVITVAISSIAVRANSYSWFNGAEQPTIQKTATGSTIHKTTYWGADCVDTSFQASWINSSGVTVSQRTSECAVQESYGLMNTRGLKLTGTDTSYLVYSQASTPVNLYPDQGSSDALYFEQTSNGTYKYVYIYTDLPMNIAATKNNSGAVAYYRLTKPHNLSDNSVRLPDNARAIVQDQSLVYSRGGRFVAGNMGSAQVIIDTITKTARRVGQNTNSNNGSPRVALGLNDTGTTLFVADNNSGSYKLYDVTDCVPLANASAVETCTSRDVSTVIRGAVSNLRQVTQARFIGDEQLELFVSVNTNEGPRTDRYVLSVPGYQAPDFDYLALGDSFASGEGTGWYTNRTDNSNNHCHVSLGNYQNLIAQQLDYITAETVACSGAKMKDVYRLTELDYSKDDPQATDKLDAQHDAEVYSSFLPGYRRQYEFVKRYKPAAVTVSISGNDINFGKKLQRCVLGVGSCYQTTEQKRGILEEIKAQFPTLVKTYIDLRISSPDTRFYVVGYPRLVLPGGNCALNVHLSEAELMLADEMVEDLNTVIKRAAQRVGFVYVDTQDSFDGHRLCEDTSWNLAVNGLTFGGDQPYGIGPISSASFHPNQLGHELFAQTILADTSSLTESMPQPDDTATVDGMPSRLDPTNDMAAPVVKPIAQDGLFADTAQTGDQSVVTVDVVGTYFTTGNTFRVELHSNPVQIGTATAVDNQTLAIDAVIPDGVEAGAHTVHIYGNNIAGEPVDIYQDIFVIASADDYDGDGILNTDDPCTFIEPAGIDGDEDGIDDSCDVMIGETPIHDEEPPVDGSVNTPGDEDPGITEGGTPEVPEDEAQQGAETETKSHSPAENIIAAIHTVVGQVRIFAQNITGNSQPQASDDTSKPQQVSSTTGAPQKAPPRRPSSPAQQKVHPLLLLLTSTPLGFLAVILIDLL